MRRQSFFFLCLFFTFGVHAQNDNSPALLNPADSSVFLYEHSMRYVGSSTHVDMNYQYVLEYLVEVLEKNPTWTVHIRAMSVADRANVSAANVQKMLINF